MYSFSVKYLFINICLFLQFSLSVFASDCEFDEPKSLKRGCPVESTQLSKHQKILQITKLDSRDDLLMQVHPVFSINLLSLYDCEKDQSQLAILSGVNKYCRQSVDEKYKQYNEAKNYRPWADLVLSNQSLYCANTRLLKMIALFDNWPLLRDEEKGEFFGLSKQFRESDFLPVDCLVKRYALFLGGLRLPQAHALTGSDFIKFPHFFFDQSTLGEKTSIDITEQPKHENHYGLVEHDRLRYRRELLLDDVDLLDDNNSDQDLEFEDDEDFEDEPLHAPEQNEDEVEFPGQNLLGSFRSLLPNLNQNNPFITITHVDLWDLQFDWQEPNNISYRHWIRILNHQVFPPVAHYAYAIQVGVAKILRSPELTPQKSFKNQLLGLSDQMINKAISLGIVFTDNVLEALGEAYLCLGAYDRAIEFFENKNAEKLAKGLALSDEDYDDLALAYYKNEQFDKAVENYQNVMRICEETQRTPSATQYRNLASAESKLKNYKSSIQNYKKYIKTQHEAGVGVGADVYEDISVSYFYLKKYKKASIFYKLKISSLIAAKMLVHPEDFLNLYTIEWVMGKYDKALKICLYLLGVSVETQRMDLYATICQKLIQVYEKMGKRELVEKYTLELQELQK